ncbi:hypothetical protein DRE_06038 [Drechslerella stenobrocha 248]|uniref:Uncharacterized protein n=1 Tax=Drechslerella stenobrocha 248 TaxID=1043628 RepID=W7I824_9PEZI|nr:hypothetical protein DRE_06038 [Drechslerella stenobrocha 248]
MADDDLAKRFESIFSKRPVAKDGWDRAVIIDRSNDSVDTDWQATDEPSLEDLLEELGVEDASWMEEVKSLSQEGKQLGTLNRDDSDAVSKLLADARKLQEQSSKDDGREPSATYEVVSNKDDERLNSDDEAEELLRQIQDSAGIDDDNEKEPTTAAVPERSQKPSISAGDDEDEDDELRRRFAALEKLTLPPPPSGIPTGSLGLPLAPTSKPATKGKKTIQQKVDDMADEVEHWCCICNEDATVKCLGCDGDLYCGDCFSEGHRGSDAPLDMKTHKAMIYNRRKPAAEEL